MKNCLRRAALVAVLALLPMAVLAPPAGATIWAGVEVGRLGPDQQYLLDSINGLRAAAGISTLTQVQEVNDRAQWWAEDLNGRGILEHSDLRTISVPFTRAAENVAYAPSVVQAHEMLTASHQHRRNMLERSYTTVAIGAARDVWGWVYVVEVFVRP